MTKTKLNLTISKKYQYIRKKIMMEYREVNESDISAIAHIRAKDSGAEENWNGRISGYWNRKHHPQQALAPRVIYVAADGGTVVGFIAGHLTRRFNCDGELQWIDVIPEYREKGIATELLQQLVAWFISQKASYICVNCAPDNIVAQNFYRRHGAENLNEYWLVWKDMRVFSKRSM
jgi:ribosomal protein S18 acetylase RimI-like enzyme